VISSPRYPPLCIVPSAILPQLSSLSYPPFAILFQLSYLCYPPSVILPLLSLLNYPISAILPQLSTLCYPLSTILSQLSSLSHPPFAILSQLSYLCYPPSSLPYLGEVYSFSHSFRLVSMYSNKRVHTTLLTYSLFVNVILSILYICKIHVYVLYIVNTSLTYSLQYL
jgi:hypothetical protein